MKIGGVECTAPAMEVLVLTRATGNIAIKCQAVLDMTPFHAMCPEPKAPSMLVKGGWKKNTDDPSYLQMASKHGDMRFAYIALKSLEPSEIEWVTVKQDDPSTWTNWEKDLRDHAKLSSVEINRIVLCIMQANSLDERKLKEARDVFLRGLEAEAKTPSISGPQDESPSTSSGEPVSDSESSHQE